jgi:hypothetical protein
MTKLLKHLTLSVLAVMALGGIALAQPPQAQAAEKIPVKLQIVFSKFEGERKTSSLPYTVFATANGDRAQINVSTNVPIVGSSGVVTYTNLGTNIDATVTTESGRYKVTLNLKDNYLVVPKPEAANANVRPAADSQSFGQFSYSGGITMKEGETKQVISAADRASGEVVKVDITLTLDK